MTETTTDTVLDQPVARRGAAADEPLTGLPLLRSHLRHPANWLQLVQFGIVGSSGFVVNTLVYVFCLRELGLDYHVAAILAFCVAVTNNFVWNRAWTFRHRRDRRHAALQGARFLTVSVAALVPNLIILDILVRLGMGKVVAQVIAVCLVVPISFLGNRLWSFR
jgi:dolichol-phosphate mannosyltransferase